MGETCLLNFYRLRHVEQIFCTHSTTCNVPFEPGASQGRHGCSTDRDIVRANPARGETCLLNFYRLRHVGRISWTHSTLRGSGRCRCSLYTDFTPTGVLLVLLQAQDSPKMSTYKQPSRRKERNLMITELMFGHGDIALLKGA
jgi:hypothetical protein